MRRAVAWFASRFPRKLGDYHDLDPVSRYASGRCGEEHQAGECHCLDSIFPHAGLFRHNAADWVMPKAMQKIVSVFPLTQGLTMMKNTFLGIGTGSILLPLCVMVGVTALCTILAIRFFRWE